MHGIVLGNEYNNQDYIEMSKTVSEWKREYCRHYYLVIEWSKIYSV